MCQLATKLKVQLFLNQSKHKKCSKSLPKTCSLYIGLNTDRSKAVLPLWFLTVTCSCCAYLYFGSVIMLVTYFVNFR